MGLLCGIVIHQTGRYLELIRCGMVLLTIGTGLYIYLGATSSIAKIVGFQIIAGLGAGMLFEPPLIARKYTEPLWRAHWLTLFDF